MAFCCWEVANNNLDVNLNVDLDVDLNLDLNVDFDGRCTTLFFNIT